MDKMDESIVDLNDKNFLNKLNYLTKKQRKIDRMGNDCFLNNKNDVSTIYYILMLVFLLI